MSVLSDMLGGLFPIKGTVKRINELGDTDYMQCSLCGKYCSHVKVSEIAGASQFYGKLGGAIMGGLAEVAQVYKKNYGSLMKEEVDTPWKCSECGFIHHEK